MELFFFNFIVMNLVCDDGSIHDAHGGLQLIILLVYIAI